MFYDWAGHGSCSIMSILFFVKKSVILLNNNVIVSLIIPNAVSLVQFIQDNWHIWGLGDERRLTCKDWVSAKTRIWCFFFFTNITVIQMELLAFFLSLSWILSLLTAKPPFHYLIYFTRDICCQSRPWNDSIDSLCETAADVRAAVLFKIQSWILKKESLIMTHWLTFNKSTRSPCSNTQPLRGFEVLHSKKKNQMLFHFFFFFIYNSVSCLKIASPSPSLCGVFLFWRLGLQRARLMQNVILSFKWQKLSKWQRSLLWNETPHFYGFVL